MSCVDLASNPESFFQTCFVVVKLRLPLLEFTCQCRLFNGKNCVSGVINDLLQTMHFDYFSKLVKEEACISTAKRDLSYSRGLRAIFVY